MGFIGGVRLGIIMIFWGGEGSRRAGAGLRFAEEWAAEEILDQVGSRLAAGRGLLDIKICMPTRQGDGLHASPAGPSFCSCKRKQKSF